MACYRGFLWLSVPDAMLVLIPASAHFLHRCGGVAVGPVGSVVAGHLAYSSILTTIVLPLPTLNRAWQGWARGSWLSSCFWRSFFSSLPLFIPMLLYDLIPLYRVLDRPVYLLSFFAQFLLSNVPL